MPLCISASRNGWESPAWVQSPASSPAADNFVAPVSPRSREPLLFNLVGEFFDDGIGEDVLGDALDLGARLLRIQRVGKRECKVFALAHRSNLSKPDLAEC